MIDDKKLFILFSVDVIDSTAMKARMANKSDGWLPLFKRFYTAFPQMLFAKSKDFILWKYIGDEILFYVEIKEIGAVSKYVKYFKETLEDWNSKAYENRENINHDEVYTYLKGCIWIAQTPKIDKELPMDYDLQNKGSKILIDFVGPSVDCGFRIAKYASKAHLIISVDILCLCYNDPDLDFYYLSSEKLKGVYDEKVAYPLFFILTKQAEIQDKQLRTRLEQMNISTYLVEFNKQFDSKNDKNIVNRIDSKYFSYFKFGFEYLKSTNNNFNLLIPNLDNDEIDEEKEEKRKNHINEMKEWFLERYEDPAENCPYESKEGGYFYLHGGPYNAEEVLSTEFSDRYFDDEIQEAAEELETEHSVYDWEMIESPYGDD